MVLGQPDFTSNTVNNGGVSASSLNDPQGVLIDQDTGKVFAIDSANHRVLIWNSFPTSNGQAADVVIGQPDKTSNTANNGGRGANTLAGPRRAVTYNGKLVIADNGNCRVLIFNSIPTTDGASADLVIGQTDMTSASCVTSNVTASSLDNDLSVGVMGSRLIVADEDNQRILVWNSSPTTNGQAADSVIGQPNLNSNNAGYVQSGYDFSEPESLVVTNNRLYVGDEKNERVLIWEGLPTQNNERPDKVLGQADFSSYGSSTANNTLVDVDQISVCNGRFVAGMSDQHRVLIWNSEPTSSNQAADLVLGQPDFTSATANNGGIGAQTMYAPYGAFCYNNYLFVPDYSNHRVLIWTSFPTSNQQAADLVLGQPNFTSNTANNGGQSAQTFNGPAFVYFDGTRLYVSDIGNNRVLIWNSMPTTNQQAADVVLGQADFSSATDYSATDKSVRSSHGIWVQDNTLWISDNTINRILVWKSIPTVNFTAADAVIGQPDFTTRGSNRNGMSSRTFSSPRGIQIHNNKLYVVDSDNNRVIILPINCSLAEFHGGCI